MARLVCAFVNVDFAILSFKSSWALALVFVDEIDADATILTWFWCALINVGVAVRS